MSNMSDLDICVGELMKASQALKTAADDLLSVAEVLIGNTYETESSLDNIPKKHTTAVITLEQIRAILLEKSGDGKRQEVKELLFKYNAGKLSEVKPEDYPALLEEAKNL